MFSDTKFTLNSLYAISTMQNLYTTLGIDVPFADADTSKMKSRHP